MNSTKKRKRKSQMGYLCVVVGVGGGGPTSSLFRLGLLWQCRRGWLLGQRAEEASFLGWGGPVPQAGGTGPESWTSWFEPSLGTILGLTGSGPKLARGQA